MVGIIGRIRYREGRKDYTISDGTNEFCFSSNDYFQQGSVIEVEGELGVASRIIPKRISPLSGERAEEAYEKFSANVASALKLPDSPVLLKDEVTEKMWPRIKAAAVELVCARRLGRSIFLRFHGDADGIAGAFALTSIIECRTQQHNSAAYTVRDALRDMAGAGQEGKPLIVLLDFGSGENCVEGLGLLNAAGLQYIVIDHHPCSDEAPENIINPFRVAENSSKYTAGYLACEIAAATGLEKEKAMGLARIACKGDKSTLLASDDQDGTKALVLDFLAAHVSFGNNLEFYRKVMEKNELFSSIAKQAEESIEEAAGKAIRGMKKMAAGKSEIAIVPLQGVVKKGEWPPSSKITTRVFDKLRGGAPFICVGCTDRSLILRLNDEAFSLGLNANTLAKSVWKDMPDFVEGGGGHAKAGALRIKEGYTKEVLGELVRKVQQI